MGLLKRGEPMCWEESKALTEYIHHHGIQQFIALMKTMNNKLELS